MYVNLLYSKLDNDEKERISQFILTNFNKLNSNDSLILTDNTIIILQSNDKDIIGCVCLLSNKYLKQVTNDTRFLNLKESGIFLYNFCINSSYRGNGHGDKLIKYTINLVEKLNLKYIHCQAETNISKHIFEKNGFIENKKHGEYSLMSYLI